MDNAVVACFSVILLARYAGGQWRDGFHSENSSLRVRNLTSHVKRDNQQLVSSILSSLHTCLKNQSFHCPPWSYCDEVDETCKCFRNNEHVFICDSHGNRPYILSCYCLTYNDRLNTTEVGMCLCNCDFLGRNKHTSYRELPSDMDALNDAMCGIYNRTGALCGKCKNNTYLRAYSYDLSCISCTNSFSSWLKYFAVAYIPLTFFYIIVLMFKINIPSSQIQGYVFCSQILMSPIFCRAIFLYLRRESYYLKFVQFFGVLHGIWNLDFLRCLNFNICFQASPLTLLSLDFVVALYPLALITVTYFIIHAHDSNLKLIVMMLKPFKAAFSIFKSNWDVRTSTIDAFITFMFLSNMKLLCVSFDLLVPVKVCDTSNNGRCKFAVFYDASISYFGHEHSFHAILAILVFVMFFIFPVLTLLLYPIKFYQKCLTLMPQRWQILIHVFVESFQGCYKDGTEPGTRGCRWFSAVPFLVRFIIFVTYASIVLFSYVAIFVIVLVLTAILLIIVDPYKAEFKHFSTYFVVFILFLASSVTCVEGLNYSVLVMRSAYVLVCLIGLLQLAYVSILILHWINHHRKFGLRFISMFKFQCCNDNEVSVM